MSNLTCPWSLHWSSYILPLSLLNGISILQVTQDKICEVIFHYFLSLIPFQIGNTSCRLYPQNISRTQPLFTVFVPAILIRTSIFFCFPVSALASLESIVYVVARVILLKHKLDHFISLLITLSWFPFLHRLKPSSFHCCLLLSFLLTPP